MPNTAQLIQQSIKVIGPGNSSEDWKIAPTEHAVQYEDQAAPLANVLRGARVEGLARMYEDLNQKAVDARDVFKKTVGKADLAIFITASLAALLLITGVLQQSFEPYERWISGTVGALGFISAALAAMWLNQVKRGKLIDRWTKERAKAEAKRLAYFKAVIEESGPEPFEQLLSLEYTRRYLLDNQIDYFRDRGAQHDNAAVKSLNISTRAAFMASLFTAGAGILAGKIPLLTAIAGLGVICSAFAAYATSRSAVNLDRRNADRYRVAEAQLKDRRLELDHIRHQVLNGDTGAIEEFFEPVFVILEADHKAFLNDEELREFAIGNMERRLDAAKQGL